MTKPKAVALAKVGSRWSDRLDHRDHLPFDPRELADRRIAVRLILGGDYLSSAAIADIRALCDADVPVQLESEDALYLSRAIDAIQRDSVFVDFYAVPTTASR